MKAVVRYQYGNADYIQGIGSSGHSQYQILGFGKGFRSK